eukprot:CAMPEP_0170517816 /NCGR_PEP_ID=MMETSP0209-20121228/3673_1 /TAXON_ID=665100 ORGANISM="Litonotus pictus, Strain P1" /NCGR_SAMPLE_ID=MMETSP0209 /ASSEMBLY_ACC=CAM_ASM_000301 /LENGTH=152 /DNA_ID=CAMNT_0010803163 /DNA_START=272 /DNA_END=727 /DNA_ORIENTATION=+
MFLLNNKKSVLQSLSNNGFNFNQAKSLIVYEKWNSNTDDVMTVIKLLRETFNSSIHDLTKDWNYEEFWKRSEEIQKQQEKKISIPSRVLSNSDNNVEIDFDLLGFTPNLIYKSVVECRVAFDEEGVFHVREYLKILEQSQDNNCKNKDNEYW